MKALKHPFLWLWCHVSVLRHHCRPITVFRRVPLPHHLMEALWTAVPLAEGKPLPSCIRSVVTCFLLLSTLFILSGCVYEQVLDSDHCWFISNLTSVCLCHCLFFKVLKLCLIMFFCTFEVRSLGFSGGSFCSYLHNLHTFSSCHFYSFFYLPLFLYQDGQRWYLLSQFFLLSTQNNLCGCCGLWDVWLLLFWHQVTWKSEKLLLHKSEEKHSFSSISFFPEQSWEGFTAFFISLQTFGHLSWFQFSLPACVQGAGVVNLTFASPLAGLIHLFPPLHYHLFPLLSFDWSLSFCFILLDTENRF